MIAADCVASSCAIQALLLCRRQESYFRCYVGSKRLRCIVLVSGMRPGGFDPGCIVIAIYCHVAIFFGGRHQAASTPVCRYLRLRLLDKTSHVQKNLLLLLEISFSSGQVLLALATHLLLWSIAFDKKNLLVCCHCLCHVSTYTNVSAFGFVGFILFKVRVVFVCLFVVVCRCLLLFVFFWFSFFSTD